MNTIFKSLAIVAVVAIAGYNISQSKVETEGMSDTMLENVEALATPESDLQDLIMNCTWQTSSYCHYVVVTPNGNTAWSHWNMRNYY